VLSSSTPSLRSTARRLPAPRRLLQFLAGLVLCALGVWVSVRVGLGVSPWDTLHSGLAGHLGASFGTVVIGVGLIVLAVSWGLGVRPGLGTLFNAFAMGWAIDLLLGAPWLHDLPAAPMAVRVLALLASVVLLGFGGAFYIGAGFGAGPRDSLMVACHHHGLPIGPSRCVIELAVLGIGWLLGGPVGLGTVVLAVGTGPVVQLSFRLLRQEPPASPSASSEHPAEERRREPSGAR
jgi:uncharacterized protein